MQNAIQSPVGHTVLLRPLKTSQFPNILQNKMLKRNAYGIIAAGHDSKERLCYAPWQLCRNCRRP